MRIRVRGHAARHARPGHRRRGPDRAAQPRPPRRRGRRGGQRRRRRHPHPDPGRLPARRRRRRPPARRLLRHRHGLPARRRGRAARGCRGPRGDRRRGEARRARLARGRRHGRPGRSHGARVHARLPPAGRGGPVARAVRHRPRPPRVPAAQARRARARPLLRLPVGPHARLQGHAHHRSAGAVLRRPVGPAVRLRDRAGALPLLHQHVPVLAARAAVPDDRAQRRDQHGARQPQLDGRPRGHARQRGAGRPHAAHARLYARRLGLGQLRRGPRAAPPVGPHAAARGDDDDPGGVGEPRPDGPLATRVLRVPLDADGAVGRPGRDHVHRRHAHRLGAGPQRAASRPVLGHRGRSGRVRVRGRRAGHRPRDDRREGPSRAGPHVPGGHRQGPHHRRPGDQVVARGAASVRRLGPRQLRLPAAAARARARRALGRLGPPPPARVRLHRGGAEDPAQPHGGRGRRAAGRDGLRHAGRGAVRPPAHALRLLHADVRAGDQPAAGRDPRGAGHRDRRRHRAGAQPARGRPGPRPQADPAVPGDRQRPAGEDRARGQGALAGLPGDDHPRPVQGGGRGRGPRGAPRGDLRRGRRGGGRRRQLHRALGPQLGRGPRAHPVAAAAERGPPPHAAPAHPHA